MRLLSLVFIGSIAAVALAAPVKVGEKAPDFELKTHADESFKLSSRKGKGWTVLFFYPKAGTPGCTKQACAFRDSIEAIRSRKAEVYGISADTVSEQAKFHKEHHLAFPLLADPKLEVVGKYGAKMDDRDMAKRWTFLIDPDLTVRWVDDKVDPVMDAKNVAAKLTALQAKP